MVNFILALRDLTEPWIHKRDHGRLPPDGLSVNVLGLRFVVSAPQAETKEAVQQLRRNGRNGVEASLQVHWIEGFFEVREESGAAAKLSFGRPDRQAANRDGTELTRLLQPPNKVATISIGQSDVAQQNVKWPTRRSLERRRKRIHRQDLVAHIREPNGQRGPSGVVIFD